MQIYLLAFWMEAMLLMLKVSNLSLHDFLDLVRWRKPKYIHLITFISNMQ